MLRTYSVCREKQERDRERERELGVVLRDTTIVGGGWKQYFRAEGSQALPASPSDRGEA
jgi:hypothetical protein